MLETSENPAVLIQMSHPFFRVSQVDSENPSGADNQQERPGFAAVGRRLCRRRRLLQRSDLSESNVKVRLAGPTFFHGGSGREEPRCIASNGAVLHVWSGRASRPSRQPSRAVVPFYGTKALRSVEPASLPFFEEHPLVTAKANDFIKFAVIVRIDGPTTSPHGGGDGSDGTDRRDDESSAAVALSGILRGHTPAISNDIEMKIWS